MYCTPLCLASEFYMGNFTPHFQVFTLFKEACGGKTNKQNPQLWKRGSWEAVNSYFDLLINVPHVQIWIHSWINSHSFHPVVDNKPTMSSAASAQEGTKTRLFFFTQVNQNPSTCCTSCCESLKSSYITMWFVLILSSHSGHATKRMFLGCIIEYYLPKHSKTNHKYRTS